MANNIKYILEPGQTVHIPLYLVLGSGRQNLAGSSGAKFVPTAASGDMVSTVRLDFTNLELGNQSGIEYSITGTYLPLGTFVDSKFLHYPHTALAANRVTSGNIPSIKVLWGSPPTGYFFTRFLAEISNTSGFSNKTGKYIDVEFDEELGIYGTLSGIQPFYETDFENVEIGQDYFIRIRGENTDYTGMNTGEFVYATGVPRFTYPVPASVSSGYTAAPIPINYSKIFQKLEITNQVLPNFDVYKYIDDNALLKTNFSAYSGIDIYFRDSTVYSASTDSPGMKITGNFSGMASGLSLHFIRSSVFGAGADSTVTGGGNGGDAVYVDATGTLNIYRDRSSAFAAGGAASPAISSGDIFSATGPTLRSEIKSKINQMSLANKYQKDVFLHNFDKWYSETGDSSVSGPFGYQAIKKYYFTKFDNIKAGAGAGGKNGQGFFYQSLPITNNAGNGVGSLGQSLDLIVSYGKDFEPEP
jgi:hypothetical protein